MVVSEHPRRITEASVALLLYEQLGGLALGSAICVRVGERILLATAAHNLRRLREVRPISRGRYRSDPLTPVAAGVGGVEDGDVGWIEIAPEHARRSRLRALGVEDLEAALPEPEQPLMAYGFPARGVEARRLGGTRFDLAGSHLTGLAAGCMEDEVALDCGVDQIPTGSSPSGLSGAGIWCLDAAGRARLVGLARAWHPGSRRLLGTPIARWLRLVEPGMAG